MDNKHYLKIFNSQSDYDSQKELVMNNPHVVLLDDTKEVLFVSKDSEEGPSSSYQMVDLGLPSGIKWANMNIGAEQESDFGLFFQWGDTEGYALEDCGTGEGQKAFTLSDYKWCNGTYDSLTKYNNKSSYGTVDNKIVLDVEDDAAHVHMGGEWRLPTGTNCEELTAHTTYEYTEVNGVKGAKFISTANTDNYVFFPGAAFYEGGFQLGTVALSWSSSLDEIYPANAMYLRGNEYLLGVYGNARYCGLPLRGVVG